MSTKAEFRSRQLKRLQTAAKETQMAGENLLAALVKTPLWQQADSIEIGRASCRERVLRLV